MAGLADILSQAAGPDTPPDDATRMPDPAAAPATPGLSDVLAQASQGKYAPGETPAATTPTDHLPPLEGTTVIPAKTTPSTQYGRFTVPEHTDPERYEWQPEDITNKIGNEATLGTGKYLAAGLGAASRLVQGKEPNFTGQLDDIRKSIHRGEAELGPDQPLVDYGVPLAEAALTGPLMAGERAAAEAIPAAETAIGRVWQAGKKFLAPAAKNATVGATVGAVSGAANTEGPNWMDYVYGAGRGATVGATLGVAIPAVVKTVGALGNAAKGLLGQDSQQWANTALREAMQADGISQADANRKLAAWVNAGSKPETVLDLGGDAVRRLARVVYTQGGKGASGLQEMLEGRASGRVDRLMGDFGEAAGTPERNVVYEQPRLEAEAGQAQAGAQTAAQQSFADVAGRPAGTRTVGQEAGATIRTALDAERQRLELQRSRLNAYAPVERSPITVDTAPVKEVVAQKLLDHEGTPIGAAIKQANSTLNLDTGTPKSTMPQMQGSLQAIRDQQRGLFRAGQTSASHHVREVGDVLQAQIDAADTSLQQANAAYRQASTPLAPFKNPQMGHAADILAQDQYRTGHVMPDEQVAARYFNPGKTASSDMQEFRQLAGDNPAAVRAMRSYIADQAQRASQGANGAFDPQAFSKWVGQHQDALRQFPEISQDLTSWAQAVTAAGNAATGSQPALMLRAISSGRDFLSTDPEQIRVMLQGMSQGEQEMFRQGAMRALRDTMGSSKGATAVTAPFSGKPAGANLRNRVAAVFGSEENYQRFAQNAAREAAMQRNENFVLSGSQTANKASDVAEGIDKGEMAKAIIKRDVGGILTQLLGFGKRVFQASQGFTRGRTAELSQMMQQPLDPSMIQELQGEGMRAAQPLISGAARGAAGLAGAAGPAVAPPGTPGQRGLPGFAAGGRVGYAGGGLAGQTLVGPEPTDIDGGPDDYTAGVPPQFRDKVGQARADAFWDKAGPQGSLDAISDFGHDQSAADAANMRIFQAKRTGQEPAQGDWEAVQNSPMMNFGLGLSAPTPRPGEGLAAGVTHDTGAPHEQAPEPAPLAAPAGGAPETYQGPVSGGRGELLGSPGWMGSPDRPASAAPAPLEGLPSTVKIHNDRELPDWMGGQREFEAGPNPVARKVASDYMAKTGLDTAQPTKYLKVDPARGARIAQAFDEMKHDPSDPLVKAAYDAMAKETMAQWKQIKKTGLKTEFIKPGDPDPYHASPRLAAEDVKRNNHLYVFPTDSGYGTTGITPEAIAENPLLAATKEKIGGAPARMNDIFRVVHDYFGHIKEGVGFRADGEENAWNSHARMYSPLARLAMTSETRGQNSWVNWGPHGEVNRTASSPDTAYADQKIGILPDWAMSEGAEGVAPVNTADMRKMLAGPSNPPYVRGQAKMPQSELNRRRADVSAQRVGLPKAAKIHDALEAGKAAVANQPDTGLFDLRRETLEQTPDVPQGELPRYEPQHGVSERMTDVMNRDDVREQMLQGIGAGVKQGSAGWYNTDQLRQAFQHELGDHGDAAYKRFLDYVSGTSPRSNVLDNIRNASFQHYLEAQGHHPNDVNPFPHPYGHLAQNNHRMNSATIRGGGYNLFDNPKPPSFAANLGGNWHPGTMDAHAMRAVGMLSQDPRFLAGQLRIPLGKDLAGTEQFQNVYPKRMFERGEIDMPTALKTPGYWSSQPNKNEYKAMEHYFRGLGREYEMDTAPTQAAAWTGHGKMTGLGTEPLPFMALFDKVLNRTAYARGEEPKETLRRFIRGEAPLYHDGGAAHENGLASGGRAVARAFHEVYHDTPKIVTHTAEKFGAKDAQKQRVAIALSKARKAGADV